MPRRAIAYLLSLPRPSEYLFRPLLTRHLHRARRYRGSILEETARLLQVVVEGASNTRGPPLALEAIEILAERLVAICLMRELHWGRGHLWAEANQMQAALSTAPPQHTAALSTAPLQHPPAGVQQVQPQRPRQRQASDESSITAAAELLQQQSIAHNRSSSLPSPPRSSAGPSHVVDVLPLQQSMARALQCSLKMTEFLHRSVNNLQSFLESSALRHSPCAQQVGVHLAVVGMDAGMYDAFQVFGHARAALDLVRQLERAAEAPGVAAR